MEIFRILFYTETKKTSIIINTELFIKQKLNFFEILSKISLNTNNICEYINASLINSVSF